MEVFLICLVLFLLILLILYLIFGGLAFIIKKIVEKFSQKKYKVNILFLAMFIFYNIIYFSVLYSVIFEHQKFVVYSTGHSRFGLTDCQPYNLFIISLMYIALFLFSFEKRNK